MTAKKNDKIDGKPAVQYLNPCLLLEAGAVHTLGEKKYGGWNFAGGMEESRLVGAALRHILQDYAGELWDAESGKSHLAHALCCLNMLYTQRQLVAGEQDQPWIDVEVK